MIINANNLGILFRAFNAAFQKGFIGVEPAWSKIATLVPSTTSEEDYGWLGDIPGLREWIGDRQVKNISTSDYSVKNKKFELTVGVPKDKVEDDKYGVYAPLVEMLGNSAALHPDELVFGLLALAFATKCYDGQYFIDSDHPVKQKDGTTASVSNYQSGSSNPWFLLDTSRPLKPLIYQRRRPYNFVPLTKEDDQNVFMKDQYVYGSDGRGNAGFGFWQMAYGSKAALSTENYNAAYAAMMAFKKENGQPLGVKPTLLVCGPSNRSAALEVVKAERLANGASNTNFGTTDVFVTPWLT
ncbi:MAG: Mu-like prophage major head subunit gpT [Syntrophus sp. PtaB.Bin001]|nr:MAG: Mu-like prophage major head subunit gpT [Syntrophus sp. PtaB.Bin001]